MNLHNRRLEIHALLLTLGTLHVYYQPPGNVQMKYPAIKYSLLRLPIKKADNQNYIVQPVYQVIVIDKDPDSPISEKLLNLPNAAFVRSYTADNLNHFVYTLF